MKKRTIYELIIFAVVAVLLLGKMFTDNHSDDVNPTETIASVMVNGGNADESETTAAEPAETETEAETTEAETTEAETTEAETTTAVTEPSYEGFWHIDVSGIEVSEDGEYTDKEHVAVYLAEYDKLPSNYITKTKAKKAGWDASANDLSDVLPGMSIGGGGYANREGSLPEADGREYRECDIDYTGGNRNAKRIVYSNDGLIYYTGNHYNTFELLYGEP